MGRVRVYIPEYNPSMSDYSRKKAQERQARNVPVRLSGEGGCLSRAWADEEWERLTGRQATERPAH